jgi:hypothetical protein
MTGIKEWFVLRVAAQKHVQLLECAFCLWMTKPIYFFWSPDVAVARRVNRFAQRPLTFLQNLMRGHAVYEVALYVHKCIKIVDAEAVAATRQQPRSG